MTNYYKVTKWMRYIRQGERFADIELPNGMKCNPEFYRELIRLGVINDDE